jgi:hypothetical protein
MANSLNPQRSQFVFQLPVDFVPRSMEQKYKDFLVRNHIIHDSILDYLNSTIQSIDLPELTFPTVEQTTRYGKKIAYRAATAPYDTITREGRVRFKTVDNHFNYFVIQDILMYHYININEIFVKPFTINILDKNRDEMFRYKLTEVVITGMGGREMGNEKTDFEFDTFDISFKVNFIDWEYVAIKKEPILVKIRL